MIVVTYRRFTNGRVNFVHNPDEKSAINSFHKSIPDVSCALFCDRRVDQLAWRISRFTCKRLVNSLWRNLFCYKNHNNKFVKSFVQQRTRVKNFDCLACCKVHVNQLRIFKWVVYILAWCRVCLSPGSCFVADVYVHASICKACARACVYMCAYMRARMHPWRSCLTTLY